MAFIGSSVLGAVLNAPSTLGTLLGFAFGPLLMVAFLGLYHVIRAHKDSVALQVATVFGVIGGAVVTMMIVVQDALFRTVGAQMRDSLGLA